MYTVMYTERSRFRSAHPRTPNDLARWRFSTKRSDFLRGPSLRPTSILLQSGGRPSFMTTSAQVISVLQGKQFLLVAPGTQERVVFAFPSTSTITEVTLVL